MDIDRNLIWEAFMKENTPGWEDGRWTGGQRPSPERIREVYMYNVEHIKNNQWPHISPGKDPAAFVASQLSEKWIAMITYFIHFDDTRVGRSDEEYVTELSGSHRVVLRKLFLQLEKVVETESWDHVDKRLVIELEDLFDFLWGTYIRQSGTSEDYPGLG